MRVWTSIVENRTAADICRDGSGSDPLSRRVEPDLMRLPLSAAIPDCFFRFFREAKRPFDTLWRRWRRLSRRADGCRLPPLRFECLAKFPLRIKNAHVCPDRHLAVDFGGRRKLRKLVEFLCQVKNLFL
ncbi:MAG: hypothetical protein DMF37_10795 [Verrucomicrobia bacterium]|nr:MAG: hypothetical protein DMF37_10795 [Verrucomicrobiota bacterium]